MNLLFSNWSVLLIDRNSYIKIYLTVFLICVKLKVGLSIKYVVLNVDKMLFFLPFESIYIDFIRVVFLPLFHPIFWMFNVYVLINITMAMFFRILKLAKVNTIIMIYDHSSSTSFVVLELAVIHITILPPDTAVSLSRTIHKTALVYRVVHFHLGVSVVWYELCDLVNIEFSFVSSNPLTLLPKFFLEVFCGAVLKVNIHFKVLEILTVV